MDDRGTTVYPRVWLYLGATANWLEFVLSFRKSDTAFFLMLLLLASAPIAAARYFYRPVLAQFPEYSELEIQFYYLTIAAILLIATALVRLAARFECQPKLASFLRGHFSISPLVFTLPLVAGAAYVYDFLTRGFYEATLRKNLRDGGIGLPESLNTWVFAEVLGGMVVVWLLVYATVSWRQKLRLVFCGVSVATVIFVSFVYAGDFNLYDYSFYAGPIFDVLHGRFLLYNDNSQYGFLSMLFLSVPFHFIAFKLPTLVLINSVLVTVQFVVLFFLVVHLIQSQTLALATLLVAILVNWQIQLRSPGAFPQTNALRFGMWVVVAATLYVADSARGRPRFLLRRLTNLLVAVSLFWDLDSGLYVVAGYLAFVFFACIGQSFLRATGSLLVTLAEVVADIAAIAALTSAYYLVALHLTIDWVQVTVGPLFYLHGFGLIPIPDLPLVKAVFAAYVLVFVFLVTGARQTIGDLSPRYRLSLFVYMYGLFEFTYFIGRSHVNNLHHVAIPLVISIGYVVEHALGSLRKLALPATRLLAVISLAIWTSVPGYIAFVQGSNNIPAHNAMTAIKALQVADHSYEVAFDAMISPGTINQVATRYGAYIKSRGITLVSENDTWYLLALGRANNIASNDLRYFVRDDALAAIASELLARRDPYVFIDTDRQNDSDREQTYLLYQAIERTYKIKEHLGSLDVLELRPTGPRGDTRT